MHKERKYGQGAALWLSEGPDCNFLVEKQEGRAAWGRAPGPSSSLGQRRWPSGETENGRPPGYLRSGHELGDVYLQWT